MVDRRGSSSVGSAPVTTSKYKGICVLHVYDLVFEILIYSISTDHYRQITIMNSKIHKNMSKNWEYYQGKVLKTIVPYSRRCKNTWLLDLDQIRFDMCLFTIQPSAPFLYKIHFHVQNDVKTYFALKLAMSKIIARTQLAKKGIWMHKYRKIYKFSIFSFFFVHIL